MHYISEKLERKRKMNDKSKILIKVALVIVLLTVCFFSVKKIVTDYVAENGESVGGNVLGENAGETNEALTESDPNEAVKSDENDIEAVEKLGAEKFLNLYCEENGLDIGEYPDFMIEMLDRNPAAVDFVKEYPTEKNTAQKIDLSDYETSSGVPLFIQWDKRWGYIEYGSSVAGISACGPVCLSMVGYYLTGSNSFSPDKIIKFAKDNGYCISGNGTAWALISEGGEKLGLKVKELPLHENTVKQYLQDGSPIICIMGPGDFTTAGHYIVLTGYEDGYVSVNDPNSLERSNKLWKFSEIQDQIRNLWAVKA